MAPGQESNSDQLVRIFHVVTIIVCRVYSLLTPHNRRFYDKIRFGFRSYGKNLEEFSEGLKKEFE